MKNPNIAQAFILALATLGAPAQASTGGETGEDQFISSREPDVALAAFERGQLGVVLPSYPRVYLYSAWRSSMLGPVASAPSTSPAGGKSELAGALGGRVRYWSYSNAPTDPMQMWLKLVEPNRKPGAGIDLARSTKTGYGYYINCPPDAFKFALQTHALAKARADATPERLQNWVAAQQAVFAFCGTPRTTDSSGKKLPPPPMPAALSPDEPIYWRGLRSYQVAAAHFYDERLEAATSLFQAIGNSADHPMRGLGAYLSLRSDLRQMALDPQWVAQREVVLREVSAPADLTTGERKQRMQAADAVYLERQDAFHAQALMPFKTRIDAVLANAALAPLHEATRATWRAAQFRLTPRRYFLSLFTPLGDPRGNPHEQSRLGDWRRIANEFLDADSANGGLEVAALRAQHPFFNWIRAVQTCHLADGDERPSICSQEAARTLTEWQAARGARDDRGAQTWLMGHLLVARQLAPEVEAAALAVPATEPSYLTVRHNLARIYRDQRAFAKARELIDALLRDHAALLAPSVSAQNAFLELRLSAASSLADATPFMPRRLLFARDRDTGERSNPSTAPAVSPTFLLDADSARLVNTRLGIADLIALASDARIAQGQRHAYATTAWLRAELLGKPALAEQALQRANALASVRQALKDAANPEARRHVVLVAALNHRIGLAAIEHLGPTFSSGTDPRSRETGVREGVLATMWCPSESNNKTNEAAALPDADLSAAPAIRDAELQALWRLPSAVTVLGEHAIARAKTHPEDPETPQLLHIAVVSARNNCGDKGSSATSRAAFKVLHAQYKGSPWARKTPYWY